MGPGSLVKIEEKFSKIYKEMLDLGVLRHKKHQVRIAKYVNQFMKQVKQLQKIDEENQSRGSFSNSEDDLDNQSSSTNSSFKSFDSEKYEFEEIEDDQREMYYKYALKKLDIMHEGSTKLNKRKRMHHIADLEA